MNHQSSRKGRWLAELSWTEVSPRLQQGAIALLPVGAGAKAHGPHLPMNTDELQARWLAEQLCERENVVIWPVLNVGYYPAFVNYHGSVSVDEQTFMDTVQAIMLSMQHAGAQTIAILNTGISTIKPLEKVIDSVGEVSSALINVYAGAQYQQAVESVIELKQGGHADEEETAIMLALYPDKVNTALMTAGMMTEKQPGPFNIDSADKPNYAPNGIIGDASKATAEKGRVLIQAMLQDVLNAIKVIKI